MIDKYDMIYIYIRNVVSFTEQTMQTLKSFGKRLKIEDTTRHQFDPLQNAIDLSKNAFTKQTFQPTIA